MMSRRIASTSPASRKSASASLACPRASMSRAARALASAPLVARQPPLRFLEQEFAKQRVVVVGRRRAAAPVDEEVPPIEVIEQCAASLAAGQRDRLRLRERRRNRGQHQHALVLGLRAIEDLAGEILEDRVLALRRSTRRASRRARLRCSRSSTSAATQPSLCRVIALQRLRVERIAARGSLPLRRACSASADGSIRAMRRLATSRANSGGGSPREIAMTVMPSGTSSSACANAARSSVPVRASWKLSRTMTRGPRQYGEELAEIGSREARDVLLRLRVEVRQRRRLLPHELQRRHPHVMHEGRGVAVGDVDLIPEVTQAARLEIARDERRLACARRGAYPDDRPRRSFVEQREEPRPRQRVVELGPRQLGEGG